MHPENYINPDSLIREVEFEKKPLENKMDFQNFLIEKMGAKTSDASVMNWINAYAKTVSNIVDNEKNSFLREAIKNKRYSEAADALITFLEREPIVA